MSSAPTEQHSLVRQPLAPLGRRNIGGLDLGWNAWVDDTEYVPDLVWPRSIMKFHQMRTDAQLAGLYYAMTMPIRRYKWLIDPNGAPDEVVNAVSTDFNMDIVGAEPAPRRRMKGRFSWDRHLTNLLLAGIYGHMFFEQDGKYESDGLWHLRKLVPVMPWDIDRINVADDGGLLSVRQRFTKGGFSGFLQSNYVELEVDRLVGYPMDMEGSNWIGRSWLRDCYKSWLIKDRLLRVDAINHERAGGVPIATAPPGATPAEKAALANMAKQFKVGEDAGGSVPAGTQFDLHHAGGRSGASVVDSIRYHDEAMARRFIHMFLQLGQTETGSRALGETFVEYAFIAQKAIAQWAVDITNEHMIEDMVDWNFGEDVQAPLLTYVVESQDEYLSAGDLAALIKVDAIQVDDEFEDALRHQYHFPKRKTPREAPQPVAPPAVPVPQPVAP